MAALDLIKAHPLEVATGLALIFGTLGNVLADSVDPITHPRLFQLGKLFQNIGIALPKALERLALLLKGPAAGSSDKPPPPGPKPPGGGTAPLLGVLFLVASLTLPSACGHGAKACKVVDITHDLCDGGLRYLAKDGTPELVTVDDLEAVHRAKSAARAVGSAAPAVSR